MAIFRLRQSGRQIAAVDDYRFPSGLRQRVAIRHGDLTSDGMDSVEAAGRQWFRLGARHPKARLAMPSVIVDDFWREFALHTREYAEFCDAALGRPLPYAAAEDRSARLPVTFRFAQEDQPGVPGLLPVLFKVDQELGIANGRHYLADCGGRGLCYELKGSVCLQHIGGPGKAPGGRRWDPKRPDPGCGSSTAGGAGCGGCGGGCGGGGS
jgi:hypothetical protein